VLKVHLSKLELNNRINIKRKSTSMGGGLKALLPAKQGSSPTGQQSKTPSSEAGPCQRSREAAPCLKAYPKGLLRWRDSSASEAGPSIAKQPLAVPLLALWVA